VAPSGTMTGSSAHCRGGSGGQGPSCSPSLTTSSTTAESLELDCCSGAVIAELPTLGLRFANLRRSAGSSSAHALRTLVRVCLLTGSMGQSIGIAVFPTCTVHNVQLKFG